MIAPPKNESNIKLKLTTLVLQQVSVEANLAFDKQSNIQLRTGVGIGVIRDPKLEKRREVQLRFSLEPVDLTVSPYTISLTVVVGFMFEGDGADKEYDELALWSSFGPGIGAARAYIDSITAMSSNGRVLLPLLNNFELASTAFLFTSAEADPVKMYEDDANIAAE